MKRHVLSKYDLLQYALDGARIERGINYERMSDAEIELNAKDIAEIERRIRLVEIAEEKKARK